MTDTPAAFQATVHGFRTIPSRGVVSITIEAPLEQHAEIAKIAVHGTWVGVARLQQPKGGDADEKSRTKPQQFDTTRPVEAPPRSGGRRWEEIDLPQQAGIVSGDPAFSVFLREKERDLCVESDGGPAECIRVYCDVRSRADIVHGTRAAEKWRRLHDKFVAWKAVG